MIYENILIDLIAKKELFLSINFLIKLNFILYAKSSYKKVRSFKFEMPIPKLLTPSSPI